MLHGEAVGLLVGAVLLGGIHGIEPGHGWPVAASYALDRPNKWLYGFAASLIIGVGHLVSSIAMVAAFFYAKGYFDLAQVNEPIPLELFGTTVTVGGPVSLVAGVLLVALGIREYLYGHSHGTQGDVGGHDHHAHDHQDTAHHQHDHSLDHVHDGHSHGHEHDPVDDHPTDSDATGLLARVKAFVPFVGRHAHAHEDLDGAADRGLFGIAWFAFVLGFAHEEEFEIIALCAGSRYCLELMGAYAITVILGIVGLTMLLIAGYQHYEERVERYTPYLPAFSATVLVVMGLGFIAGVF